LTKFEAFGWLVTVGVCVTRGIGRAHRTPPSSENFAASTTGAMYVSGASVLERAATYMVE